MSHPSPTPHTPPTAAEERERIEFCERYPSFSVVWADGPSGELQARVSFVSREQRFTVIRSEWLGPAGLRDALHEALEVIRLMRARAWGRGVWEIGAGLRVG